MRGVCLISLSLVFGGALLAAESARRGVSALKQAGLSILLSSSNTAQIVVSGTSGGAYGLASTEDFLKWTHWPLQTLDTNGRAIFAVPFSSRRLFFRAFSTEPTTVQLGPPEIALGQRLFLETRFAQFFFAHTRGDVNASLANGGDPVLNTTLTVNTSVPGPFAGQSMSCRACHFVSEHKAGLGARAFADFALRSPIPDRGDGHRFTARNTPALANASISRPGPFFLHFDGEFPTGEALVKATLTGRNFGWLPAERTQAIRHIAQVLREDNGQDASGRKMGGAYRTILAGADPAIPAEFRLPEEFRIDVAKATDDQVLDGLARILNAYLRSLTLHMNDAGEYEGSPYDLFLKRNSLPRRPAAGEDDKSYSRRLRNLVGNLKSPVFVTPKDGSFTTHAQEFIFGPAELEGFKTFFAEPGDTSSLPGSLGNCIACHAAPHFTDFRFHNTGATQWEYDSVHGEGAFAQIPVPGLAERLATPEAFLPPTAARPDAKGRFNYAPAKGAPGYADLGLWNVYANPDFPASQAGLHALLSASFGSNAAETFLPKTIALFKTPGLRDLGHSAPYLHTGQSSTLEAVLFFYRFTSGLAREQRVRNSDPEMARIFIVKEAQAPLAAFLRSLNEEFE
jgi:cytochrome c peroxidase